jgi:hypothetical protein
MCRVMAHLLPGRACPTSSRIYARLCPGRSKRRPAKALKPRTWSISTSRVLRPRGGGVRYTGQDRAERETSHEGIEQYLFTLDCHGVRTDTDKEAAALLGCDPRPSKPA